MPNAGKSTLLNALLGAICLPSSNVPETARITRIIHTPLEDGKQPELTYQPSGSLDKRTIVGEYGIRESLLPSGFSRFNAKAALSTCMHHSWQNEAMQEPLQEHNGVLGPRSRKGQR